MILFEQRINNAVIFTNRLFACFAQPSMKILAISGSLREGSSNHNILKYLSTLVPDTVDYQIYKYLANIPAFDPGLDNDTPPPSVRQLRETLAQSDAVIICTPEYAFGVPGQLKNMLDWLVSSSSLVDKPVMLITASSQGKYAHESLQLTLGALTAKLADETNLLIPFIRSKMDGEGNIVDEEVRKSLDKAFNTFINGIT